MWKEEQLFAGAEANRKMLSHSIYCVHVRDDRSTSESIRDFVTLAGTI